MTTEMNEPRIALVTGASRGIGAAIAKRLQQDGFNVFGTATSAEGAAQIDKMLGRSGAGLCFQAESPEQIEPLIKAVETQAGSVHVLVNNAGITHDGLLLRLTSEDLNRLLQVNLLAAMNLSRAVLRGMSKARQGRIINVSSVVAQMGNAGQTGYVAAKVGLEGFTRALASEMGGRNITVNAVAPGFIQTDMTDKLNEAQQAAMLGAIALGRMGQAEEVASAISFLASDAAAYITGAVLPVNGGLYMG